METKAYFVNLPVSPKKARFYLPAIKKLKPAESLEFLMYENTDASEILYKAIKSAISSARQTLKVEDNLLKFKLLSVEQGQKLKRYRPGSRGNAKPINRRMSHVKIILESSKTLNSKHQITNKSQIQNSKQKTKKV
ncbi:MAG: 50S ribosomal protein L22 [Candidatus Roizmanbacteria bacterium GW2011_GWC2_34_23]|uniref:50S ribosomal protein L22 n=1 Tax=Candidatus Roizmanbacteria bacterium GW2011_GWC2_34_23 TaxID=1618484 RepID=A0A0G0E6R1_9BACT|nr:MAG: 50S ribosomal protein L22 [Candidatus Roizmanbacteria bacterium GW2011_GWC2_34_23]